MALQSQLLSGDPKLEAAATTDSAHIKSGAKGEHVRKIQLALIQLDSAEITADGAYGPATAAAVLAYKQKRNIINRSYQNRADDIVGKMTMASLDTELLKREAPAPRNGVRIKPLTQSRVRPSRSPALLALIDNAEPAAVKAKAAPLGVTAPRILPGPDRDLTTRPGFLPGVVLEMRRNSVGRLVVTDGAPGELVISDGTIATLAPDAPVVPGNRVLVLENPQTFKIFSGKSLGRATITANSLGSSASVEVVVKTFFDPPKFVPGVNHGHTPSRRYPEVQKKPNNGPGLSGIVLEKACPLMGPAALVELAKRLVFTDKPIALRHLNWYLSDGKGADFVEDDNIKDWLTRDSGIRSRLKREIFKPGARVKGEGSFLFEQSEYAVPDFQFAFGAIDRVDFAVDFSQDTVRVWFQDRYEWHPVYPFYTFMDGDGVRETNCLHAALVELKDSGAADFWMKGQAEIALSLLA
jgi:peptidoglycan hydrolase-like protein with peptidoglycan-binding domain